MSILDEQVVQVETLRAAKFIHAYLECSDSIQEGIRNMLDILNDPESDEDDRHMAVATLADALFPDFYKGHLGMDLQESEDDASEESQELQEIVTRMNEEEATFADRLRCIMEQRKITQKELADRIGVGQPAISNMLNRQCRPQKRTLHNLAAALEVAPTELWPSLAE